MPDYLFLLHDDATQQVNTADWDPYSVVLVDTGRFQGGSAIGDGICMRKSGSLPAITALLGGFLRVAADTLDHAQTMLAGNPVIEAGGTVEIRELLQTD